MAARSSPPDAARRRGRRAHVLTARRDFARLQASGRSRAHRLMVVRSVANEEGIDRFGIATSRRLGGAVERNRVRRRIREIVRRIELAPRTDGLDILIVARRPSVEATFGQLRDALLPLLIAARDAASGDRAVAGSRGVVLDRGDGAGRGEGHDRRAAERHRA